MQIGEIGKGIAQRRKQMGLSQEELAKQIGVTRQAVSKWESGAALPSVDNIVELARVLDASVDELLQLSRAESDSGLNAQSVGRLLDEHSLRQETRIRRLTILLAVAAVVLALGIVLSTVLGLMRTSRLEESVSRRIADTNAQMQSVMSRMSAEVAGAVERALDEGSSLLSDGGFRGLEYVYEDQAARMKLFAYPKVMGDVSGAEFYALLKDGTRYSVPAEAANGGFEAVLDIPAGDVESLSGDAYVSWVENGERVTEKIAVLEIWLDGLRLRITELYPMYMGADEEGRLIVESIASMTVPGEHEELYPDRVLFEYFAQDTLIEAVENEADCEPGTYYLSSYAGEIMLPAGTRPEDVTLRVTVTDMSGHRHTAETSLEGLME